MSLPDPILGDGDDEEVTTDQLNRRSRHLSLRFWGHWRNEYLLELKEAHQHHKGIHVEVRDIVVVHSDDHQGNLHEWNIQSWAETGI